MPPWQRTRCLHTLVLAALLSCTSFAQAISNFRIEDGRSFPFLEHDDGVIFKFFNELCGDLDIYLGIGGEVMKLTYSKQEFRGHGVLRFSSDSFTKLCDRFGGSSVRCSLVVSHVSCRTNHYTENSLLLLLTAQAPYGCKFVEMPTKPSMLSTSLTRPVKKTRSWTWAVIGIAGALLCSNEMEKHKDDSDKQSTYAGIGLASVVMALYSLSDETKYVPDDEANLGNDRLNRRYMEDWQSKCRDTEALNRRIANTYQIDFSKL